MLSNARPDHDGPGFAVERVRIGSGALYLYNVVDEDGTAVPGHQGYSNYDYAALAAWRLNNPNGDPHAIDPDEPLDW